MSHLIKNYTVCTCTAVFVSGTFKQHNVSCWNDFLSIKFIKSLIGARSAVKQIISRPWRFKIIFLLTNNYSILTDKLPKKKNIVFVGCVCNWCPTLRRMTLCLL